MIAGADAVYICTWTSEHPRQLAKAVAAGRHVFCEKPLATTLAAARRDGRPRPGRRHRQPGRAGPAPLAGVPARQAPRRRSRRRTADGRGDARRPVHPGAGPLRQHLAGRPRPRRRRHAARAQHPRHRHADVPRRADRAGQCAHHQLPRPRRDRGRRLGDDAVLRRRAGDADERVARQPRPPEPAPRRAVLRAPPRGDRWRRLVRARVVDRPRWRHR